MPKEFGQGIFSAYRQDGVLHVVATGQKPTLQTKVTIDQLPFMIFPPEFALNFETDGITSPIVVPFDIDQAIPSYPKTVKFVIIVDKNGTHKIDIVDKPDSVGNATTDPTAANFVVYQQIGTDRYMIAKSDAIVPAIYFKVFGPDTYAKCQAYVAAHTKPVVPELDIVPGSLDAWIDRMPGPGPGPKLIVTVDAVVEVDWTVTLVSAVPQGINPLDKLLRFDIVLPTGPVHSNAMMKKSFRYEETPAQQNYTDVTIENGGSGASTKVKTVN
ncbi:hypothetical protein IC762_29145 [Bradyrhizobium genosp. L]|uniref:hypothetical protein n=1 Tax=Bradyrhizobium genosp. L TaxID=83637 RepID=UPI0018A333BF|nr:hypothetical protein [Bradyrhizobium genosp. L]QPF83729.1 hypothetical protein IC762_29145 [Bradyrhizobium genosp. L]